VGVRRYLDRSPQIDPTAFLDPTAVVIGDVVVGAQASIWCHTTLRGDVGRIRIGPRSNVQDSAVVHQTGGLSDTVIGADVTVGHSAILHGCIVHDRVLVGMGAILMDNAEVGPDCLVAAGSLLAVGKRFLEPGWLILGRPARAVRLLTDEERESVQEAARLYVGYAEAHRRSLGLVGPPPPAERELP